MQLTGYKEREIQESLSVSSGFTLLVNGLKYSPSKVYLLSLLAYKGSVGYLKPEEGAAIID